MKSKIGTILAGLYTLLVIYDYIEDANCSLFCGFGQIILGAPWTFKMFNFINDGRDPILFLLLNVVIIYFIGLGISKIIKTIRK